MMLRTGEGAETIIVVPAAATGVTFGNDCTLQGDGRPELRVACHSATKGFSQVEHLTCAKSGTDTVTFAEADVDMVSVERQAGGHDAEVGYLVAGPA